MDTNINSLADKLETLTDYMRAEQALMKNLAETQIEMKPILAQIAAAMTTTAPSAAGSMDEQTRTHIRSLDNHLNRLTEELSSGREDLIKQIRSEIKLLARTIAASGATPDGG